MNLKQLVFDLHKYCGFILNELIFNFTILVDYFSKKFWRHPPVLRKDFKNNPLGYRFKRFMIDQSRLFEYFYVKFYNMQKASRFHQKMIRLDQFGTGYQFFTLDPDHVLSKDEAFHAKAWGYTQKVLLALKEEVDRFEVGANPGSQA